MAFRFISNLRTQTIESFVEVGYQSQGWLLSTHRATNSAVTLARTLREQEYDVFVDNGTKPMIDHVVNHFKPALAPLIADIKMLRRNLEGTRRIPRPSEIPVSLRKRASDAAHAVCDLIDALLGDYSLESLVVQQAEIQGNHVIAKEDFAISCLTALGLEREITGWPIAYFDRRNKLTIELWQQNKRMLDDPAVKVYATLSAMDYATARSAARLAAKAGVAHVSFGFAGINKDRTFTEVFNLPYRTNLPGSAPRQYVRTTEILLGIRDGFAEENRDLKSFHGLGLGATAEFPILCAVMQDVGNLSVDATSPIHDAVNDLVYYDEANRGDRVTAIEAATTILEGQDYVFDTPVMNQCTATLNIDVLTAREWWASEDNRKITKFDLKPEQPLGMALQAIANGAGSSTTRQRLYRIAHNHWVCDFLAATKPENNTGQWAVKEISALIDTRTRSTKWGLMAARQILEYDETKTNANEEQHMTGSGDLWRNAMAIKQECVDALKASESLDNAQALWQFQLEKWELICNRSLGSGLKPGEHEMISTGRSFAVLLHSTFHQQYLLGGDEEEASDLSEVFSQQRLCEDLYEMLLATSREAAKQGRLGAIRDLESLLEALVEEVSFLCAGTGNLDSANRNVGMVGIKSSHLARRVAMFSAAWIYLQWRMLDGRSISGLKKVAKNRSTLMREQPGSEFAERFISDQSEGDRIPVTGRIKSSNWIDRPEIPYSYAKLQSTNFEYRVHRRDLMAIGMAPGRYFWARGKYELSDDAPVVVSEFEGIDQHAGDIWEDYLAAEVRDAYDLHPGSIDALWEFPHVQFRCGMNDFLSRISKPVSMEVQS